LDLFSRGTAPAVSTNVVIVEITDEDYEKLFSAHSPLNPEKVLQLIQKVELLDPVAIGVDLDTQDHSWASADRDRNYPNQDQMRKIVWAEVPEEVSLPEEASPKLRLTPILGGRHPSQYTVTCAVTRFPQEVDGVVRKYTDSFLVDSSEERCARENQSTKNVLADWWKAAEAHIPGHPKADSKDLGTPVQSFHHALVERFREKPNGKSPRSIGGRSEYLRFTGGRYDFQIIKAGALLEWSEENQSKTKPWVPDTLTRKIVLIGGSFSAARDEYMTPVGKMPGVELIGHAIEAELDSAGTEKIWLLAIPFDIVLGILIVGIFHVAEDRLRWAFWCSVGTMLVCPFLLSAYLFYNRRWWLILFGGIIGVIYYLSSYLTSHIFWSREVFYTLTWALGASLAFPLAYVWICGQFFYDKSWPWLLNFVPIMFGMIVHQMYDGAKLAAEFKDKLQEKKNELSELERQLDEARSDCEQREAANRNLLTEIASVKSEKGELRAQIKRLGGHVRAKGHHAG
jgi:CHASE2 domain-containing sensor protein